MGKRVFISSVTQGLRQERTALPGLIRALGMDPVRFEDFTALPEPSRDVELHRDQFAGRRTHGLLSLQLMARGPAFTTPDVTCVPAAAQPPPKRTARSCGASSNGPANRAGSVFRSRRPPGPSRHRPPEQYYCCSPNPKATESRLRSPVCATR